MMMEKHPLVIENIVSSIIQYETDYTTLKSLRLVHPSWNSAVLTSTFQSKTFLDIDFKDRDVHQFLAAFPIDSPNIFLPNTVALSHLPSFQHSEKLIKWFQTYGSSINHLEVNKEDLTDLVRETLLRKPGVSRWFYKPTAAYVSAKDKINLLNRLPLELLSSLETLRVPILFDVLCIEEFKMHLGKMKKFREINLPRLRSLEISTGDRFLPACVNPDSVNRILKSAPNLEILKLRIEPSDHTSLFLGKRDSLFYGVQPHYLHKLVELDLSTFVVEFRQLQLLATIPFEHLKKLCCGSISCLDTDIPPQPTLHMVEQEFQKLLRNVKTTLESSTANVNWLFNKNSTPDPMSNLKYVKNSIDAVGLSFTLGNMNVLEELPNLEELRLHIFGHSEQVLMILLPHDLLLNDHPLKILNLKNITLKLHSFRRLVTAFPHLESLSVGSKYPVNCKQELTNHLIWNFVGFLSELKALMKLASLDFTIYCENQIQDGQEFWIAITEHLPHLLVLKKCTIVCQSGSIQLESVTELSFPPLLGYLKLKYFTIDSDVQQMLHESLKQKKIHLDLTMKPELSQPIARNSLSGTPIPNANST